MSRRSSRRENPMDEISPRFSRRDGGAGPSRTTIRSRYAVDEDEDIHHRQGGGGGGGEGDLIECSGKYCKSCTAGLIADCVALCCCPCALVNFLALAFVKVPYMVGRKCLGRVKRKRKKRKQLKEEESRRKCTGSENGGEEEEGGDGGRNGRVEGEFLEFGSMEVEEEEMRSRVSTARIEAERVWLEMYEVGQFGFGRISISGIQ